MSSAMSIALSGLVAQSKGLAAAAENIANSSTIGSIPTAGSPRSNVYNPLSVSYTSLMANDTPAGVIASIQEDQSYTLVHMPSSIYANEEGFVAAPNVDIAKETTDIMLIKHAYKANVAVIKAQEDMLGDLIDSIL